MRLANKELVELVCSLSSNEKQFFKKQFKGEHDFIYLFDYINKRKAFKKEKFEAYINKKNGKKRNITAGHLSVIKNYLKERIMESLRSLYATKRISFKSMTKVMNSDILMEKGLYQLSLKELEEAKGLSFETGYPIQRLLLMRRESLLLFYNRYKKAPIDRIQNLFDQRIAASKELLLEIEYSQILSILSLQQYHGTLDHLYLEELEKREILQDDFQRSTFVNKYLYFWNKGLIEKLKKNHQKAVNFFSKAVQIWLDHPGFMQSHPRMFLGTCTTYLDFLNELGNRDPIALDTVDLKLLLDAVKTIDLADDENKKYQELFLLHQLLGFVREMNYDAILAKETAFDDIMKPPIMVSDGDKITLCFIFALARAQKGHFEEAQRWIQIILDDRQINLTENPVYFPRLVTLNLILYYELGNIKYLQYQLPKCQKLLQSLNFYHEYEVQFFKLFSKLVNKRYVDLQDYIFEKYEKKLDILLTQNHDNPSVRCSAQHLKQWVMTKNKQLD